MTIARPVRDTAQSMKDRTVEGLGQITPNSDFDRSRSRSREGPAWSPEV
jgi:hypothetical protein